jgi:hypothetical protein
VGAMALDYFFNMNTPNEGDFMTPEERFKWRNEKWKQKKQLNLVPSSPLICRGMEFTGFN